MSRYIEKKVDFYIKQINDLKDKKCTLVMLPLNKYYLEYIKYFNKKGYEVNTHIKYPFVNYQLYCNIYKGNELSCQNT